MTPPTASRADVVLRTEGLTKKFGHFTAVDGLNLEVRRGDIYGLLGLNGAGKTTTIRMVVRLIAPTAGKVLAFGEDVRENSLSVLNRIGAMVEIPQFYPYLAGRKNLELLYGLSGGKDRGRVDECLALVGLDDRGGDKVRAYSQGMRQRLGLAQALLTKPELIILDEPTNGLDPQGILDIRNLIRKLNTENGVTFVISSHLLHEIELTCNRVAIVHKGRLRVEDEVKKLLDRSLAVARVKATPMEEAKKVFALRRVEVVGLQDGAFKLRCGPEALPDLAQALHASGCEIWELTPGRATLEDFFMAETGRGGPHAA
ncbi:MAG: ABC transporter ATP-binding protein [Planctomycetes bacterium]|nr:ABC transporter ATP-binding protein [Planctomycetota bacterium]